MFSFPLICMDEAQTDQQPITTKTSNRGRQSEKTATDSNKDTQKQNFDFKVENGVVKYKLQNVSGSHENSMRDENSTKVCLTNKSNRGGSQSVEQNDPKPLTIVPIQENAVSHKVLLENFEGKLCEEQRPSTKRQLSAESAAKSVSVRKRSTVKKSQEEIVKPLSIASPGTQSGRPYLPAVSSSQRKPRKLLLSSTDIFNKVDTFSIKKGKEVTDNTQVFVLFVPINNRFRHEYVFFSWGSWKYLMLRRLRVQSPRGAEMIWKTSGPYGSGYAIILVTAHAKNASCTVKN